MKNIIVTLVVLFLMISVSSCKSTEKMTGKEYSQHQNKQFKCSLCEKKPILKSK